jgi:hypothetical protein
MVQGDDESFSVLREKRFKGKMMKGFHVIREKTIYKRNSFAAKGLDMEGMNRNKLNMERRTSEGLCLCSKRAS